MFFKRQLIGMFLLFYGVSLSSNAQQELIGESSLLVQPNKCVALNQGRDCFAKIMVSWRQSTENDYCLFVKVVERPPLLIKCWDSVNQAQWEYEFQSAMDGHFILMEKSSDKVLASATIQVSWLYKANTRKRRWRLF
ncbi:DUF3019 domain-containing protein [Paraglaciecola aquimarina]|uniref:DUF3019 domain-containing protein n=1 Tax=Paraglaciecola aquimarina TaxID=1235557 RepID=A0ABU3SUE1_9ALTE|nr:DUF3019 domain-containing protein [Paraglaciecola aquimarina]MDU0353631.1 DUF3019 domain-containing protein [Paraglaciecola aquimarina]